jgi:hypothetical protein
VLTICGAAAFDGRLALQHESELDEELSRGCEVVNHDADVLHPLDSHVFADMPLSASTGTSNWCRTMPSALTAWPPGSARTRPPGQGRSQRLAVTIL